MEGVRCRKLQHLTNCTANVKLRWAEETRPAFLSPDTCFARIPALGEIKAFLLCLTRTIKGQFANRSNVTTIETYWGLLQRTLYLRIGHKYSGEVKGEVRQVRKHLIALE